MQNITAQSVSFNTADVHIPAILYINFFSKPNLQNNLTVGNVLCTVVHIPISADFAIDIECNCTAVDNVGVKLSLLYA